MRSTEKLYTVWTNMRKRCQKETNPTYKYYGARGIKVCDEWNDYEAFREWAYANGYKEGNNRRDCTLDRIDVNGNYEPSNCRWITAKQQHLNTRKNVYIEYKGERHTLLEWAQKLGINYKTFGNRWRRGWSIERMIEEPTHMRYERNEKGQFA